MDRNQIPLRQHLFGHVLLYVLRYLSCHPFLLGSIYYMRSKSHFLLYQGKMRHWTVDTGTLSAFLLIHLSSFPFIASSEVIEPRIDVSCVSRYNLASNHEITCTGFCVSFRTIAFLTQSLKP